MQDIGYNDRNALTGLGTLTFLIFLYFIRCVLILILKFFLLITNSKFGGKKLFKRLKSN